MLFLKNTVLFLFIIISLVSKSQTRIDTVYSAYQKRIETVTFTNKNQKTVYQYSFSTPQFIQSETKFLNGKKHGKFIQYSEKNIVSTKANYKNGRLWGKQFIYKNGKVVSEKTFENDTLNGKSISYYPSGIKQSEVNYLKGMKYGKCKFYFKSGVLSGVHNFDTIIQYNTKTKRYEIKEVLNRVYKSYFENGLPEREDNYIKGNRHGRYLEWYENGKLKYDLSYQNNYPNGRQVYYYINGNIEKRYTAFNYFDSTVKYFRTRYVEDYEEFFDTGKPKLIGFYDNQSRKQGSWKTWSAPDFLEIDVSYKNGFLVGNYQIFYPRTNKIKEKGFYRYTQINGKDTSVIDGDYSRFDDSGNLHSKELIEYRDNIMIKKQLYLGNGTLVSDYYFKDSLINWVEYFDNGNKKQESYAVYNPLKNISEQDFKQFRSYHENGNIKVEGYPTYETSDRKKADYIINYNDSGKVIGVKLNIKSLGLTLSTTFYPTGNFKEESLNNHDLIKQSVEYFDNGKPKSFGIYGLYKIKWLSNGDLMQITTFNPLGSEYWEYAKDTSINFEVVEKIYDELSKNQNRYTLTDLSDGIKTSYFTEGKPYITYELSNKVLTNFFKGYYIDGSPMFDIEIKDGELNGSYATYYSNGRIEQKGKYLNGLQIDEWFYGSYTGDTIKYYVLTSPTFNTYSDKIIKNASIYKEFWITTPYQNTKKLKLISVQHPDPAKCVHRSYYENGNLEKSIEFSPKSNLTTIKNYYSNGSINTLESIDSLKRRQGYFNWSRENGQPSLETYYVDGKKNGEQKSYHKNGQLMWKGTYFDDRQVGEWIKYNEKGDVEKRELYDLKTKEQLAKEFEALKTLNPCLCEPDKEEKPKKMFYPSLKNIINTENTGIWQFGLHTPISKLIFDKLFVSNHRGANSSSGTVRFFSADIVALEEISTSLPDVNGIKFILNPCHKTQKKSIFPVSAELTENMPNSLKVRIFPKEAVAFRFNSKLLTPVVSEHSEASFKIKKITYSEDGIELEEATQVCFTKSKIAGGNAVLELTSFIPDSDLEKKRYDMFLGNRGDFEFFHRENKSRQAGLYNGEGTIKDITDDLSTPLQVKNVIIGSNFVMGEVYTQKKEIVKIEKQVKQLLGDKARIITQNQDDTIVLSFMITVK